MSPLQLSGRHRWARSRGQTPELSRTSPAASVPEEGRRTAPSSAAPPEPPCRRGAAGPGRAGGRPLPNRERRSGGGGAGPGAMSGGGPRRGAGSGTEGVRRLRGMGGGGRRCPAALLLALPLLALPGGLGKPTAWQERARPGAAQQHEDAPGFRYDHEAFLGKEEARSFDQLSPEESQERLG